MKSSKTLTATDQRNWPSVIGGLVILGLLCLLLFYIYDRRATTSDYEGKVVDRWAEYSESDEGSHPYYRLLVEGNDHKRFTVKVDPNVYESARIGMHIRSRAGQVVLIDTGKSPAGDQ